MSVLGQGLYAFPSKIATATFLSIGLNQFILPPTAHQHDPFPTLLPDRMAGLKHGFIALCLFPSVHQGRHRLTEGDPISKP